LWAGLLSRRDIINTELLLEEVESLFVNIGFEEVVFIEEHVLLSMCVENRGHRGSIQHQLFFKKFPGALRLFYTF